MRGSIFLASALFACSAVASNAADAFKRVDKVLETRNTAKQYVQGAKPDRLQKRTSLFLNNATQKFVVDGTKIPDVDFDVGESYAGLVPISSNANETRELFFWFFPSSNPLATDEIVIWFNGGPGCSSLSGLLTVCTPRLEIRSKFSTLLQSY